MDQNLKKEMEKFAVKIRMGVVDEITTLGFGHIGGSLSVCDTLAVLYGGVMKIDPKNPKWADRDKFVCSKGHAGPAVYAALGLKGFFPYEDIKTLNVPGTNFPSHCDKNKTIGVDMTTGSLGQGTSQAVGLALGDKLKGRDSKTYLMVGDGEADEGQVWEAMMFASAKKLDNLYVFVDFNKKQLDGYVKDILDPGDFGKKFEAFGFDTQTVNGNDVESIYDALEKTSKVTGKPHAIILDTVKGAGVTLVAETMSNHSMNINKEQGEEMMNELKAKLAALEA